MMCGCPSRPGLRIPRLLHLAKHSMRRTSTNVKMRDLRFVSFSRGIFALHLQFIVQRINLCLCVEG